MDVEYIARLAKINLDEKEKSVFSKQFENIIKWINDLNEVDTSNIMPQFSITNIESSIYEDQPEKFHAKEKIIENFPNKEYDFVKVKKVI
ncbi:MAG: Asp-tRNA(Asn)/Glu-tRNA(Gln) amidotransferase subunit GatC [Elusimicrobiota bacterium]